MLCKRGRFRKIDRGEGCNFEKAFSQEKPHPRPEDEPTSEKVGARSCFLAFVSTDTNLHSTRYLELPSQMRRSITNV